MVEPAHPKPPPVALDDVDQRLIAALRKDGRLSVRSLAEQIRISRASAYSRLERLQESGVITGYTAVIDPARYGLGSAAYVHIKITQGKWRLVRDALLALDHVEHVAFVTGDFDLVVLVRAADVTELRDVVLDKLHSMPGIASTHTVLILDEAIPPR